MSTSRRAFVILVGLLVAMGGRPAFSQDVDLGGRAFGDYFYAISAPDSPDGALSYPVAVADSAREGLHGFAYRRLYLTVDFRLSDRLEGRARLEANDGTTGPKGPIPYVKDLWLEWTYSGEHSATVGVTGPPAFELSGDVWGYRSLEKTILDRRGIVDSRDFGVRLDGPLFAAGNVRYAVMYANNSAVRPELDQHKRVYGRLSARPTDRIVLAVGGDYATYADRRDRSLRLSAFAGYETDRFRAGLEGYRAVTDLSGSSSVREYGVSLFGHFRFTKTWGAVGRVDWATTLLPATDPLGFDPTEFLLLAGITYRPHPNVEVIPNIWVRTSNRYRQSDTLLRLTLDLSF